MENPALPENPAPRWREDFPIRWDNDNYVTRRDLIKFLTLGSLLLVGANLAIAVLGKLWRPGRYPRVPIARAADLSPQAPVLFRYPSDADACILVRAADGKPQAFSQVCTHLSCAVTYRPERGDLYCPCHVGVFQVSDGRPIAGPPSRPLARILLEERDGAIYAVGVEEG
jgi:arsenite oxidase small subunit